MDLDVLSQILGHSKTETTEKRYVKYRTELLAEARKLMVAIHLSSRTGEEKACRMADSK